MALEVKHLPANKGDVREVGLILGSGRFPGGGNGNSLQYFCLENPMDKGPWHVSDLQLVDYKVVCEDGQGQLEMC